MNILLNPNIAYILLVLGSVLLLMAIVTPGTHFLEFGALFVLALAGYAIYNLGFNLWALIVLVLSLVPFVYAIQKPKRELILALSLLGVIVGSVYLFPSGGWLPAVNPVLAVIVSALTAVFMAGGPQGYPGASRPSTAGPVNLDWKNRGSQDPGARKRFGAGGRRTVERPQ